MIYEIEMQRSERVAIRVQAASPDEALRQARAQRPGYSADTVLELDADGEVCGEHLLHASCDGCGAPIWEGQPYAAGDDHYECAACADPATLMQPPT